MVTGTTSTHLIDAVLNPMSASDILASL